MNGHSHHPSAEELAEFRAGATDRARGERLTAHLAECPDCASLSERLDQIPVLLASVPSPAMPGQVETRIAEALAAEAARRDSSALPRLVPVSSSPAKARRRPWWRSPVTASLGGLAAAACLVLAFVGFRLSGTGSPGSPPAASGTVHPRPGIQVSGAPDMNHDNLSPAPGPSMGAAPFTVLVSTTNYRQSTLRTQITRELPAAADHGMRFPPSRSLVGCVTSLTRHATPALVEEATYQSRPVYVIAVSGRAWVVARDCTPANPAVLASVALAPGR